MSLRYLSARDRRIQTLGEAYNAHRFYDNERSIPRKFCAVWKYDREGDKQLWATFDTFEEAADHLADCVLDGGMFEAIFDLDTGERIDLHVTTPIVSRSEEQGLIINPLRPEED
jgi:hypothetical protein